MNEENVQRNDALVGVIASKSKRERKRKRDKRKINKSQW